MLCESCQPVVEQAFGRSGRADEDHTDQKIVTEQIVPSLPDGCVLCLMLFQELKFFPTEREVTYYQPGERGELVLQIHARNDTTHKHGQYIFTTIEPWSVSPSRDPWAALVPGNPALLEIPESTEDPRCMHLASKWLELCAKNHPRCSQKHDISYRPPRLLHLQDGHVCLVSRSGLPHDIPIAYAALSYCVSISDEAVE